MNPELTVLTLAARFRARDVAAYGDLPANRQLGPGLHHVRRGDREPSKFAVRTARRLGSAP